MLFSGIAIAIIFIIGLVYIRGSELFNSTPTTANTASSTNLHTDTLTLDQNISDGTIVINYPSSDFGLATNKTQILVTSYIPPCDEGFGYCLYYKGAAYHGTNFESAGIRVQKRVDLAKEKQCLNTPPSGFDANTLPNKTNVANSYSTSVFSNVGDAAAGHMASGSLYRLYIHDKNTCYEFETRIGQTQFANYPTGTIQEFTASDSEKIKTELKQIIDAISLPTKEHTLFP